MQSVAIPDRPARMSERHVRILDAAETCFVRTGFHRTTMQDVANEAGMSAGNLYRYFRSKEAIVAGLAERDRAELGGDFAGIAQHTDFLVAFEAMGRKHLIEEPRECSVLAVEIWSEATRNPHVASVCSAIEAECRGFMHLMFAQAQQRGEISADLDVAMAARLMMTCADGLVKRRALDPDFDGERELAMTMSVFRALFAGRIPMQSAMTPEAQP
jgi:AcrR family transcriptional regulator